MSKLVGTNLEDYSVYSHLSDEELIQLAIERSLTDTNGNTSVVTSNQSAYALLISTQSEVRNDYAMRREAVLCIPYIP